MKTANKASMPKRMSLPKLTLLAITIATGLSGCSVGPDYIKPEAILADSFLYTPSLTQNTENLEEQSHWWLKFNDEALNMLVTDAQQQNIPLQVAAERVKSAQAYQRVVESFKVPTVSLSAGFVDYQISKNDPLLGPAVSPIAVPAQVQPMLGESITLTDQQNQAMFVGASITWELDLFGRIDQQANAAELRKEQVEIYRSGLTTLITADVIHNYIQLRGAQERKALALDTVADQEESLLIVKAMVETGFGSELNLAQAKAYLAMTKSVIPQIEIAEQAHKQRLSILLGESLSQINERLENGAGTPTLTGIIPTGLPSDLLKRRPDLRIAEREIRVKNSDLAVSIANKYPKFFLTGSPGLVAGDFDDLFSGDSFSWLASVGVSWNLFDGGRSDALVEIQEAGLKSSVLEYQYAVNNAFTEVDSYLYIYGRSQENQQRVENAKVSTEIAVSKAVTLYEAGLIDYLSVLDAQRQRNALKDHALSAKLQTAQVAVGLHKALGGDWSITTQIAQ